MGHLGEWINVSNSIFDPVCLRWWVRSPWFVYNQSMPCVIMGHRVLWSTIYTEKLWLIVFFIGSLLFLRLNYCCSVNRTGLFLYWSINDWYRDPFLDELSAASLILNAFEFEMDTEQKVSVQWTRSSSPSNTQASCLDIIVDFTWLSPRGWIPDSGF